MEKQTDVNEKPKASTPGAAEETKGEILEQSPSASSGVADRLQNNPEESEASPFDPTGNIQADIPGDHKDCLSVAKEEIASEQPADSSSTANAGEGVKVQSHGKSGSTPSRAAAEIESTAMRRQLWSRRRVITLAASLGAGFIAAFWAPLTNKLGSALQMTATRRRDNPYFRLNKSSAVFATVELKEGFYARKPRPVSGRSTANVQRKNIIQYVDSQKRIPFERYINASRLREANPTELTLSGFTLSASEQSRIPTTHVSLGRASALFEIAAIHQLKAKQYGPACVLLIDGIRHDLAFKNRLGGAPSLRLLDLLAIVSVRQNQKQHFEELLKLSDVAMGLIAQQVVGPRARRKGGKNNPPTKQGRRQDNPRKRRIALDSGGMEIVRAKLKADLQTRVTKWKGETWQAKVKKEVKWAITIAPDTTKEKNHVVSVAI